MARSTRLAKKRARRRTSLEKSSRRASADARRDAQTERRRAMARQLAQLDDGNGCAKNNCCSLQHGERSAIFLAADAVASRPLVVSPQKETPARPATPRENPLTDFVARPDAAIQAAAAALREVFGASSAFNEQDDAVGDDGGRSRRRGVPQGQIIACAAFRTSRSACAAAKRRKVESQTTNECKIYFRKKELLRVNVGADALFKVSGFEKMSKNIIFAFVCVRSAKPPSSSLSKAELVTLAEAVAQSPIILGLGNVPVGFAQWDAQRAAADVAKQQTAISSAAGRGRAGRGRDGRGGRGRAHVASFLENQDDEGISDDHADADADDGGGSDNDDQRSIDHADDLEALLL
jgi:hypothetical protein